MVISLDKSQKILNTLPNSRLYNHDEICLSINTLINDLRKIEESNSIFQDGRKNTIFQGGRKNTIFTKQVNIEDVFFQDLPFAVSTLKNHLRKHAKTLLAAFPITTPYPTRNVFSNQPLHIEFFTNVFIILCIVM